MRFFQASLLKNAVDCWLGQILFRMWNSDLARLSWVLELMVRPNGVYEVPAVGFYSLNKDGAVHALSNTQ